jgi:hypothetical protein
MIHGTKLLWRRIKRGLEAKSPSCKQTNLRNVSIVEKVCDILIFTLQPCSICHLMIFTRKIRREKICIILSKEMVQC